MMIVDLKIPFELRPSAYAHKAHWAVKAKQNKKFQNIGYWEFVKKYGKLAVDESKCYNVVFTRHCKRKMDDDNLSFAFKPIRDQIADLIFPGKRMGLADGDPRLKFYYEQVISKDYAIQIQVIECLTN
ncbi:MAG: hypothetical protein ACYC0F_19135 [Rhodanobacter sp.]